MAIPHFQATFIGRTRSAVASAAYRHRSPMLDMSTGQRWSYRGDDVVHAQTSVPDGAPAWAQRLVAMPRAEAAQLLWNVATAAERQVNGQPARELMIALPIELSRGENIALMQEYVAQELCTRGLVCDWVFHDKPGNPHVHLMHTLRPLTATGFGIKKVALRAMTAASCAHRRARSCTATSSAIGPRSSICGPRGLRPRPVIWLLRGMI